jgi:hypothetical protein
MSKDDTNKEKMVFQAIFEKTPKTRVSDNIFCQKFCHLGFSTLAFSQVLHGTFNQQKRREVECTYHH